MNQLIILLGIWIRSDELGTIWMVTTYVSFIKSYDFDEKKNKAPFALLNIHILQ
jgi:hypothetical protein